MKVCADLHVHSCRSSDGRMTVEEIFDRVRAAGLNGVAIADHNSVDGTREALDKAPEDLVIFPAAEMSTDRGHMLCYFVKEPPERFGIEKQGNVYLFEDIRRYVKIQGGLIFAAHMYRHGPADRDVIPLTDGIEIFNGRETARRQQANDASAELVREFGVPFTAGSDAHLPGDVGSAYKIMELPEKPTESDLRAALLAKHGTYYGRYLSLTPQGLDGMRRALRDGKPKRFLRNAAKAAVGAVYDPTRALRRASRDIAGGRTYEV
ncbi:MAG: PHP domain-containing protein [Oscillospiraceae bacterium]|nr:PHP domain-containing protein [Oscillospiraceae bacterium]